MNTRRIRLGVTAFALALALALGVVALRDTDAPSPAPVRAVPNIVLITVDTLRADRLGSYGHPTNRTPTIDRLAREGMLFESAYCDLPWTTGSMASVMTGQYSNRHGVTLPTTRLKGDAVTMAEILGARGFQTGAIIGSFPLDSVYGLDQGFETYDDRFSLPIIRSPDIVPGHVESVAPDSPEGQGKFITRKWQNDAYRPDEEVTDAAIAWLEGERDGRPFLLWVHYFGPHEKLRGDVGFVQQEPAIIAAYDGDVEKNDVAVGRFVGRLEALGLLDDTIVIVHADHGQNLGENRFVGHGLTLDEPSIRIPLIVRYPRLVAAGGRRADIARNIDILPTVLTAIGVEVGGLEGRSLLRSGVDAGSANVAAESQTAYFSTVLSTMVPIPLTIPPYEVVLGPVRRSGVRVPDWKFVEDEIVGPCTHGVTAVRDGLGTWSIRNAQTLEPSKCQELRATKLFAAVASRVNEDDVAAEHPELAGAMTAMLDRYAEQRPELSTPLELSPEAEEKLRSLGYIR